MPVSVPIDDIVFAWNNYLKSIYPEFIALGNNPVELQQVRQRRMSPWPAWRTYIAAAANSDYGITILNAQDNKLCTTRDSTIHAIVFDHETQLTQFLLKFGD